MPCLVPAFWSTRIFMPLGRLGARPGKPCCAGRSALARVRGFRERRRSSRACPWARAPWLAGVRWWPATLEWRAWRWDARRSRWRRAGARLGADDGGPIVLGGYVALLAQHDQG